MYEVTMIANPKFDFSLLNQFSTEHLVKYRLNGNCITFVGERNYIEDVCDQLSNLKQSPIFQVIS